MKIWYLEAESCYECEGPGDSFSANDPDSYRAVELDVPGGIVRDWENAKRALERVESEFAPYIQAVVEAKAAERAESWRKYKEEHPGGSPFRVVWDGLLDFQMRARPLFRDIT